MVGVILRLQTTANQSSIRFHCNLNFPKLFKPKRNNTPWTGQEEWVHKSPLFEIKPAITCTNLSWFNISWVQWIYESWPVKLKNSTIDLETLETQLITSSTAKYLLWIRLLGFTHPSVWVWGFMGRFYGYKNAPTEKIQQTWCGSFLFFCRTNTANINEEHWRIMFVLWIKSLAADVYFQITIVSAFHSAKLENHRDP